MRPKKDYPLINIGEYLGSEIRLLIENKLREEKLQQEGAIQDEVNHYQRRND